jgi:hypothetical protein
MKPIFVDLFRRLWIGTEREKHASRRAFLRQLGIAAVSHRTIFNALSEPAIVRPADFDLCINASLWHKMSPAPYKEIDYDVFATFKLFREGDKLLCSFGDRSAGKVFRIS